MVKILHVAILDFDDGNCFRNFVRLFKCLFGFQILDARAHETRSFARIDMLKLGHHPRIAVLENDHAFLNVVWRSHGGEVSRE